MLFLAILLVRSYLATKKQEQYAINPVSLCDYV